MPNKLKTLDFNDTFIDVDHAIASFPAYKSEVKGDKSMAKKPFRYSFYTLMLNAQDRNKYLVYYFFPFRVTFEEKDDQVSEKKIVIEPYYIPSRGPYPTSQPNVYVSMFQYQ